MSLGFKPLPPRDCRVICNQNDYPREALPEALPRFVKEDLDRQACTWKPSSRSALGLRTRLANQLSLRRLRQ